jgi:hypothetical protein
LIPIKTRLINFVRDLFVFETKHVYIKLLWRDEHGGVLKSETREIGALAPLRGVIYVEMNEPTVENKNEE